MDRLINVGDIYSFTDKDGQVKSWLCVKFEIDNDLSVSRTAGIRCNSLTNGPEEVNTRFDYGGREFNYNKENSLYYDELTNPQYVESVPLEKMLKYTSIMMEYNYYVYNLDIKKDDERINPKKGSVVGLVYNFKKEDAYFVILGSTGKYLNDPTKVYGYAINTKSNIAIPNRIDSDDIVNSILDDELDIVGIVTPKWYALLRDAFATLMGFRIHNIDDIFWYKF